MCDKIFELSDFFRSLFEFVDSFSETLRFFLADFCFSSTVDESFFDGFDRNRMNPKWDLGVLSFNLGSASHFQCFLLACREVSSSSTVGRNANLLLTVNFFLVRLVCLSFICRPLTKRRRESNPGWLGGKRERFLCAMPSPQFLEKTLSSVYFESSQCCINKSTIQFVLLF